jgi:hypothetical protein
MSGASTVRAAQRNRCDVARTSRTPEIAASVDIPRDVTLQIVSYRGYWDFPRHLLVRDPDGQFWLLDCRFCEDKDDFDDHFEVVPCGRDPVAAARHFSADITLDAPAGSIGRVPVRYLRFDETLRRSVSLLR